MRVKRGMDKTKLRPQELLWISFDGHDLSLYPGEVAELIQQWNRGDPIWDIAAHFGRIQEEMAIHLMFLALIGRIEPRAGGVFGREQSCSSAEISGR